LQDKTGLFAAKRGRFGDRNSLKLPKTKYIMDNNTRKATFPIEGFRSVKSLFNTKNLYNFATVFC